jgi:hypothetical protein
LQEVNGIIRYLREKALDDAAIEYWAVVLRWKV